MWRWTKRAIIRLYYTVGRHLIEIDKGGRAAFAQQRRASPNKFVIGIDEVGRGSLAGPVVVAAVALPPGFKINDLCFGKKRCRLKDSKKLSKHQRLLWWQWLKNNPQARFSLARVYPPVIDQINIARAANLAATRACRKLAVVGKVLLDGNLKISNGLGVAYRTIIKGDEKYNVIKLASIVAKVHRDRLMMKNDRLYRGYGFACHKGYGTKQHIAAIEKQGLCPIHRRSFKLNLDPRAGLS